MVLTGRRRRGKKKRKRRKGREGGKEEEEEEESLKSIASLTECASDPSEGGLMPSHLSQNFSIVHLSIWEQNGFAISWRLMN